MTAPKKFNVQISKPAERDLDNLPPKDRQKVLIRLAALEADPFRSPKIRKLKAKGIGQWRLEAWPYRVRYDIMNKDVVVYRVRHRKDIYKN